MRKLFSYSRHIVLLPIVVLLFAAAAMFLFSAVATVNVVIEVFTGGDFDSLGARAFSIEMIEMIDLVLLGTVLLITSTAFYQLFIDPDVDLPDWMSVSSLGELKSTLLAVIVVMLSILFLGGVASLGGVVEVETEAGQTAVAPSATGADFGVVGLSIAAVLVAIGLVVWLYARAAAEHSATTRQEP